MSALVYLVMVEADYRAADVERVFSTADKAREYAQSCGDHTAEVVAMPLDDPSPAGGVVTRVWEAA